MWHAEVRQTSTLSLYNVFYFEGPDLGHLRVPPLLDPLVPTLSRFHQVFTFHA